MSYAYNLDGSLNTLTYPSGASVTYTPDSAGRAISAVDSGNVAKRVRHAVGIPENVLINGRGLGRQSQNHQNRRIS
jgi:hypothetical protein